MNTDTTALQERIARAAATSECFGPEQSVGEMFALHLEETGAGA